MIDAVTVEVDLVKGLYRFGERQALWNFRESIGVNIAYGRSAVCESGSSWSWSSSSAATLYPRAMVQRVKDDFESHSL